MNSTSELLRGKINGSAMTLKAKKKYYAAHIFGENLFSVTFAKGLIMGFNGRGDAFFSHLHFVTLFNICLFP